MKGDRENYGRGRECLRLTIRLYGEDAALLVKWAKILEASPADVLTDVWKAAVENRVREGIKDMTHTISGLPLK